MKRKHIACKLFWGLGIFIAVIPMTVRAQEKDGMAETYRLSLKEAIGIAKSQNKIVASSRQESSAAAFDLKDARMSALPVVQAAADYQRFTSLTLYNHGLSEIHSVPKLPTSNGADLGVSAAFNLYSGGKQKALVSEMAEKKDLASISSDEQMGAISLQVAVQYLEIIRLNDQQHFIDEQVTRAETRLKNISALYRNQKVTRSDLLRAELNLSAVKLNLEQTVNDLTISGQKLNVLLNLSDSSRIIATDSAAMPLPQVDELFALAGSAGHDAYEARKIDENVRIQQIKIKSIRSNSSPTLAIYSGYGFSYPNNIFYPPVDQGYSIGFVGLKLQYDISSIYQNPQKVAAGRTRLKELQYIQQDIGDNLRHEVNSLLIKYREALNRIAVNEKSIEQARVNYKIVNAKYLNQLALLTDLLDADNLYQETRYNLVQAESGARLLYYRLLFTAGKL